MIVIDISALIAIFRLEPEMNPFLATIVEANERCLLALSLLEASMVISGCRKDNPVFEPLDAFLVEAGIKIAPFDANQARLVRDAFFRFGKGGHSAGLNMGDCASYLLAKSHHASLLYKGDNFSRTDITPACRVF